MVVDNRSRDDVSEFLYYNLRGAPVRVALNKEGNPFDAESYDPQTDSLTRDVTLLSKVETDPYSDEITEQGFLALCSDLQLKKKHPEPGVDEPPGALEL